MKVTIDLLVFCQTSQKYMKGTRKSNFMITSMIYHENIIVILDKIMGHRIVFWV